MMRPTNARRLRLLAVASGLAMALTSPARAGGEAERPELNQPDAGPTRLDRARAFLSTPDAPDSRRSIAQALAVRRDDPQTDEAQLLDRQAMLTALSQVSVAPSWVLDDLRALAAAEPAALPDVLTASASIRTRDAARFLLDHAAIPRPEPVRTAALAGLERLTGRVLRPRTYEQWSAWLKPREVLSESDWRTDLIAGLAQSSDALREDRAEVLASLRSTTLRLYRTAAPEERSQLLSALLAEPYEELREAAFDLIQRELSDARPIAAHVVEAVVGLLRDPSASVRTKAAMLVNRLAPPDAGPAVADALSAEQDPEAAAELLRASARWPTASIRPVVVRWLEAGPPTRSAAAEAALALHARNLLRGEGTVSRILAALRAAPDAALDSAIFRLMVVVGEPADRERVERELNSADTARRQAAAEALALIPEAVDRLVAAARTDAALRPVAVAAVLNHMPGIAGYTRIESMFDRPSAARTDALVAASRGLNADELLGVASSTIDPALRDALLSPLLVAAPAESGTPTVGDARQAFLLLAQARLDLGRPDAAMAAMSTIESPSSDPAVNRMRLISLLWLNRLNEAWQIEAPPEAWLDALQYAAALPHARVIEAGLSARFGNTLPPEQTERLRILMALVAAEEDRAAAAEPNP